MKENSRLIKPFNCNKLKENRSLVSLSRPDDKLYIGVGDATQHEFAQDPGIVIGKVLRINSSGVANQSIQHTFNQAGTVKYYCTLHPFMSGEVIIK